MGKQREVRLHGGDHPGPLDDGGKQLYKSFKTKAQTSNACYFLRVQLIDPYFFTSYGAFHENGIRTDAILHI